MLPNLICTYGTIRVCPWYIFPRVHRAYVRYLLVPYSRIFYTVQVLYRTLSTWVFIFFQKKMDREQEQQERSKVWICDTVSHLFHPNPQSVCDCLCLMTKNERMVADKQFQMIVQWLEDTIIRQWEPKKRKELLCTKHFWNEGIKQYLQDLDCPIHYYYYNNTSTTTNIDTKHLEWRYDFHKRKRILHWIFTCAISDSYEERKQTNNRNNSNITSSSSSTQEQQIHDMRLQYIHKMKQIQLQLNQQICNNIQLQSNNDRNDPKT